MSEWIVISKYATDPVTGQEVLESEERFDLLSSYTRLAEVEQRLEILEEFMVQHLNAHAGQGKLESSDD